MKEILNKVVDVAVQKYGAEYAEVRGQKLFKTMLTLKEGRVEAARQGIENGAALRVLVNGAWGFASVGTFDVETLIMAVSDACKMAKATSSKLKKPIKLIPTNPVEDKVILKPRKDP
ncbi:MAG: DNA gyrase modulator, partial [Candidatus Bathyarchaeia archaeon]|nr:DNA gyrase modulator [Candidatus Bathyarchaeia archaeon]